MPERLCGHEPCACELAPGSRFCDPVCEAAEAERTKRDPREAAPGAPTRAAGDAGPRCPCDHPECRPGKAERFASDEAPVP